MNATERILACLLVDTTDLLSGRHTRILHVTVDTARGPVSVSYEVTPGEAPGEFTLAKPDGEAHTVSPGGRCTCSDLKFKQRFRPAGCKHVEACRLAGFFQEACA